MKRLLSAALLLVVSVLLSSSCLRAQRAHHQRELALKAGAEADLTQAQADALRSGQTDAVEPVEFVEGESAPVAPAPEIESVPAAPTEIHVWIAGAHVWRQGSWHWVPGHWALPPHVGAAWLAGRWLRRGHGFVWVAGGWR